MTTISPLREPDLEPETASHRDRRVLHVVRSLEVGGLERVVCELALQRGVTNSQVACLTARGDFADTIIAEGGVVHDLSLTSGGRPALWRQLVALMRSYRPDVVHCHNMFAHALGSLAAMRAGGLPTVLTKHGTYLPRGWVRNTFHRKLMQRSLVVAVSREIQDTLLHWSPSLKNRLWYVPNGVRVPSGVSETERQTVRTSMGWLDHEWTYISVCRMVSGKRIDCMLRAFAGVLNSVPNSRLVLVGDGPELAKLKELAAQLQLGNAVSFLGQRMDVARLLGSADTFVLSSENEGMPMALLEAMGAGLPVVATRVGEIPSLVVDETTGYMVPPGDVERLEAAMRQIAANQQQARQMGVLGRDHIVSRFSLRASMDGYEGIYRLATRGGKVDRRSLNGTTRMDS